MTVAGAPSPRRLGRPRWLDPRVIGGVLLLIASIVVGAKVVGGSSHTSGVWSAGRDLAVGTVIVAGDLTRVEVNLGDRSTLYIGAAAAPVGRVLNRAVAAGELLPATALSPVAEGRVVVVGVTPDRMPPGVGHGSVIDLYLTTGGSTSSGTAATTRLINARVTVQSVTAPAAGGLSGATSTRYQVAVLMPTQQADALVRTLPQGEPIVVLVAGGGP